MGSREINRVYKYEINKPATVTSGHGTLWSKWMSLRINDGHSHIFDQTCDNVHCAELCKGQAKALFKAGIRTIIFGYTLVVWRFRAVNCKIKSVSYGRQQVIFLD